MARPKDMLIFIFTYILLNISNFTKSLPIKESSTLISSDSVYTSNMDFDTKIEELSGLEIKSENRDVEIFSDNITTAMALNQAIRPGQVVEDYTVTITRQGDGFHGLAIIVVTVTQLTMKDPIVFNMEDLNVQSILVGVLTTANAVSAKFDYDGRILNIFPPQPATTYSVIVEYSGSFRTDGTGLHLGRFDNSDYISMNLYPTHARKVFPCMDDPSPMVETVFTFNNMEYNYVFLNSMLEDNSETTFKSLNGPNHLWGLLAHNLNNIMNIPVQNVHLYARQGQSNQETQAILAISYYFTALNEWAGKPYSEIISNQDGRMNIVAVPDISRDWYALSTICIWEPYILINRNHAVKQRQVAFVEIAEAMARQWFGFVRFPENFRHQWVLSGLSSYAAYDVAKQFQTNPLDDSMIDMNTIFTMDVIRESLLIDAYSNSLPLNSQEDIFDENIIRMNINGLSKIKSPAILRMLRLIVNDDTKDIVQDAARALMASRSLQRLRTQNFYDALRSRFNGNDLVPNVDEFLNTWIIHDGYPVVNVISRENRIILTQERFGFSSRIGISYPIPISFTTSINPNFNDVYPTRLLQEGDIIFTSLVEDDWIILNLQGQGYYRVNYDEGLWERLIWTLQDSDKRNIIHPLNRAILIDDALNLARAGSLNYGTALSLVLTMEHETEYAVWKAFVRNMDFIRKYLIVYVNENSDEGEDNIYLRMIQRTIHAFEEEIGFTPDPIVLEPAMTTMTRGLLMEHACRAGYAPCIAAAIDWFYDPNNQGTVNPDIPPELQPAVYCSIMREGNVDDRNALLSQLEIKTSSYERLVIIESLACSEDEEFIQTLLDNTISGNSPYVTEERSKLFLAIASSSFQKANLAVTFITRNTNAIRNLYGGPEKLEEVIIGLRENLVSESIVNNYDNWVSSLESISNLQSSDLAARAIRDQARVNLLWYQRNIRNIYEWIDKNDALSLFVSVVLLCLSMTITLLSN